MFSRLAVSNSLSHLCSEIDLRVYCRGGLLSWQLYQHQHLVLLHWSHSAFTCHTYLVCEHVCGGVCVCLFTFLSLTNKETICSC